MKPEIKKEILYDLTKTIQVLEKRENKDIRELELLSNHGIDDVALYKDMDLVSVTVLIYSLYKVIAQAKEKDYQNILDELKSAKDSLTQGNLGKYNSNIKKLYKLVKKCNARVKVHLQDVMEAAKIKKSSILFQKGLSIGQAAGLMGLSNWDLQAYAGRNAALDDHHEKVPAKKRVMTAFKIFGVS